MRALAALMLAMAAVWCLGQGYAIRDYHVDLELSADGTLMAEEVIQVEFSQPRRGIFRDIPEYYRKESGQRFRTAISDIYVTDETGRSLTTHITREGNNRRIRIGDEDIFLEIGQLYTYVVRYRVRSVIQWFDSANGWESWSELYWDAIGGEWDTTIDRARVTISFPEVAEDEPLRLATYIGSYGSTAGVSLNEPGSASESGIAATLTRSTVTIDYPQPISPGQSLTFALGMPEDAIAKPPISERLWHNSVPYMGFLTPLLVLVGMGWLWLRMGRDPKADQVDVFFEPPDEMTGAQCGTLIDERVDKRDLVAAIVSLAVKGHLTIHPKEVGMIFKRRTADLVLTRDAQAEALTVYEKALLKNLEKAGSTIDSTDLRTYVAPHVTSMAGKLYQEMVNRGYYRKSPQKVRDGWTAGALFLPPLAAFLINAVIPGVQLWTLIIGGIMGVGIGIFFAGHLPKRTPLGSRVREQVIGFRNFMAGRENYMEWFAEKKAPEAVFEEYLPYAVAFGIDEQWIRSYEGLLTEPPSWYVTPVGMHWGFMDFGSDFSGISRSLAASAGTPPSSSGSSGGSGFSSGGGFSGGGFGGGGGGSW